jgi:hypothetical protein
LDEGIIQKKGAAFYGFILWKNIFFAFIHPFTKKILLQIKGTKNEAIFYFLLPLPTAYPLSFISVQTKKIMQ